jgi:hypothetical protein
MQHFYTDLDALQIYCTRKGYSASGSDIRLLPRFALAIEMADPELPPLPAISPVTLVLTQLSEARRWQRVATLASAIIIKSGHPYSIEQALEIVQDIYFVLYPGRNFGPYREWEKTKDARLKKVHV